jgi:DNA (cytosine-5)-methyltransferase 1
MSYYDEPIMPSDTELMLGGTYPLDYDCRGIQPGYLIGMSVPPVMMANIAAGVYNQWLSKIKQ